VNLGKAYKQLFDLQDVLYKDAVNEATPAKDKAACARAWEALEERKRIMRGKPLPGSFKPEAKPKRPILPPPWTGPTEA